MMIQSVSVRNMKSFGQMKAELWAKKFWGFRKLPSNTAKRFNKTQSYNF